MAPEGGSAGVEAEELVEVEELVSGPAGAVAGLSGCFLQPPSNNSPTRLVASSEAARREFPF